MRVKINRPFLGKLRATGKPRQRFFDTDITSFFVRVLPGGKLSFGIMYGPKGKRKQVTIGSADVLSLDQAREQAKKELSKATLGGDPAEEKAKRAAALTFKEWKAEYLEHVRLHNRSFKSDELYLAAAERFWGGMLLGSITPEEITKACQVVRREGVGLPITSDVTTKSRKLRQASKRRWKDHGAKNTTANRFLASVRACLSEAWRRSKIAANPALQVKPLPENPPRQRVLSTDEYEALLDAVAGLQNPHVRLAFAVMLDTGCRLSEVLQAKWEDFDLETGRWSLTTTKSKRPLTKTLPSGTLAALKNTPKEGTYLVPGFKESEEEEDRPRHDLKKAWADICEAANLTDVHIHDLRRSFGLEVYRKYGLGPASKALGHSSPQVTAKVYSPLQVEDERRITEGVAKERAKLVRLNRKKREQEASA